jgi:hypothetical protein
VGRDSKAGAVEKSVPKSTPPSSSFARGSAAPAFFTGSPRIARNVFSPEIAAGRLLKLPGMPELSAKELLARLHEEHTDVSANRDHLQTAWDARLG